MTSRSLGHRAPLLWVLLPLMAGLILGKLNWVSLPPAWLAGGGVILAGLALGFRRAWAPCIAVSLVLSGTAFYELTRARLPDWDTLPPREARVTLRVDRMFSPRPDGKSASGLGRIRSADAAPAELAGQSVYFSINLKGIVSPPIRSSELTVVGVLQVIPRDPSGDTFDRYLANAGVNFRLTRGWVVATPAPATAYRRFCDAALHHFDRLLDYGIGRHQELGAIFRAMLLGQQQELSEEQHRIFMQSGIMHLFSISGLHIATIAGAIYGALALLRLPRWAQLIIGGGLLWLYVDITGGTPSAVRAWIMVMALYASLVIRVPGNPIAALVASAVVVLIVQPMQLFSASFQLSYGIVAALLLLGLPLGENWTARWALFEGLPKVAWRWHQHACDRIWRGFLGMLAIGVASTLVGTVLSIAIFQLFTPGALVANLVLIPVSVLVVLAGVLSLLCGLVGLGFLGGVFNHAGILILAGIEQAVRFFVTLPGVYHPAQFSPAWLGNLAVCLVLAAMLYGYANRWERRRGGFWPPVALTVLALVLGVRFG
ncbi:MAG TPA: ComEC/Rec2 family competence protein [Rariglobus sp.]|jgi:competence protein ComEC|nr:ComEC/Rec2 family competence protein [Rariglobus sp.]